ncbi:hypothetical protein HDU97_001505 [Phlyctochytrium planicorne]|nr:hypothetical protein HDU97_001505 [Phlyctochytrium planicorne]
MSFLNECPDDILILITAFLTREETYKLIQTSKRCGHNPDLVGLLYTDIRDKPLPSQHSLEKYGNYIQAFMLDLGDAEARFNLSLLPKNWSSNLTRLRKLVIVHCESNANVAEHCFSVLTIFFYYLPFPERVFSLALQRWPRRADYSFKEKIPASFTDALTSLTHLKQISLRSLNVDDVGFLNRFPCLERLQLRFVFDSLDDKNIHKHLQDHPRLHRIRLDYVMWPRKTKFFKKMPKGLEKLEMHCVNRDLTDLGRHQGLAVEEKVRNVVGNRVRVEMVEDPGGLELWDFHVPSAAVI